MTTKKPIVDTEAKVREFIDAFGIDKNSDLWAKLCDEEWRELIKEACDFVYVMRGFGLSLTDEKQKEAYDEGVNLLEEELSKFFEPWKFYEAFRRVHNSNMSKLGEDGEPIRREDGKILKGPNYKEPDFSDISGMK